MSKVVDLIDSDEEFEKMQETLVIEKGQKVNLDPSKKGKYIQEDEEEEEQEENGEEKDDKEAPKKKKTKRLSQK
jgi:hypothetical protein